MTLQYTLVGNEDGTQNLTAFVPGEAPATAHSTHPNWDTILEKVLLGDESALDLFDVAKTAGMKFERLTERVTYSNGRLYLDGEEIHNSLAETVVRFLQEGVEDWRPLVAFFENVQANPNEHSREQLYDWITEQNLSLTEDGLLIGYKGVTKDDEGNLVSCTSGTAIADGEVVTGQIPNAVGTYVEMPRTEVMHNPWNDCDAGLHVGSYSYASDYGTVVIEVHVNPRDVVSVPNSSWKMRCCRYKVIGVLRDEYKSVLPTTSQAEPYEAPKAKTKTKDSKKREVKEVRVGDVYADTDKRRAGREVKVKSFGTDGSANVEDVTTGKKSVIALDRLQSRKYKLVKRGRKK